MQKRCKTRAFAMGLIAGILNLLYMSITALTITDLLEYGAYEVQDLVSINGGLADGFWLGIALFILIALVNLAGACVCRVNRIAGGVMMLSTAVLFTFLFTASCILSGMPEAVVGLVLFLLPLQALSIIAAITAFKYPGEDITVYPSLYGGLPTEQPHGNAFLTRYAQQDVQPPHREL